MTSSNLHADAAAGSVGGGTALRRSNKRLVRVWDAPLRAFHWLLVATIIFAFLSAEEGSPIARWHITAGWVAGLLIAFRLVWGVVGGQNARFSSFVQPTHVWTHIRGVMARRSERSVGHNPLGGLSTILILAWIAAVVFSGVRLLSGTSGEDLHETLANLLLVLIGVHVVAVLIMSFLTRENLIGAMVTGAKRAALHEGSADARRAPPLALPLALFITAVAAYGATRIDPLAFSAHTARSESNASHLDASPKPPGADAD